MLLLVASIPCQKRATFSSSGLLQVTSLYIQYADALSGRRDSCISVWKRRMTSSGGK